MRAAVFAYQEIGFVCLEELLRANVEISCLFTHEDDPGEEIWFRTPATLARGRDIPVYTPDAIRDENWVSLIRGYNPDVIFSFYYRKMIPNAILEIPRIGAFNLHGSLLPKYRGRCPVNWVILAGEEKTGVTLHYMVEKPDAGDIIAQREVPIAFDDDVLAVYRKMIDAARLLMRETLPQIISGTFTGKPQTGPSSYFGGRGPEDGYIDWGKDARSIYNLVRAVTHPYPGAFTYLDGQKFFIWKAYPEQTDVKVDSEAPVGTVLSDAPVLIRTGSGLLRLISVQPEGGEEMDAVNFASTHGIKNKKLGGHT